MLKVAQKWLSLLLCAMLLFSMPFAALSESAIEAAPEAENQATVSEAEVVQETVEYEDQLIIMPPYFSGKYRNRYKNENLLEGLSLPLYLHISDDLPVSVFPLDMDAVGATYIGGGSNAEAVQAITDLNTDTNFDADEINALKAETAENVKALLGYSAAEPAQDATTDEIPAEEREDEEADAAETGRSWSAKRSTVLFFSTMSLTDPQKDLLLQMSQDENVEVFHVVINNDSEDSFKNITELLDLEEIKKPEAGLVYDLEGFPDYHAVFVKDKASAFAFCRTLVEHLDEKLNADGAFYMPLQGSEHQRYMTLHGAATRYVRLFLSGLGEQDTVSFTDEAGQPIEAEPLYAANGAAVYQLEGNHGNRINVTIGNPEEAAATEVAESEQSDPAEFDVNAFYNYAIEEDFVTLKLYRENNSNTFIKNSNIEYSITFSLGSDSTTQYEQLIKDIEAFDNSECFIDWISPAGEEMRVATEKQIDIHGSVYYTAMITLNEEGDYQFKPSLAIGNRVFGGEPLAVTVTNKLPEIELEEEPIHCWFDDPWAPINTVSFTINASDNDNDTLKFETLAADGTVPRPHILEGIGTLFVDANGVASIDLKEAKMQLEPVVFRVRVSEQKDLNAKTEADVAFRLLSMKECLQMVEMTEVEIDPPTPQKYDEIKLTTSASFDKLDDCIPVEDVKAVFEERAYVTVQAYRIEEGERIPEGVPFVLEKVEGEAVYTGNYTFGDTSMELVYEAVASYEMPKNAEDNELEPIKSVSATIAIGNLPPALNEGRKPETTEAMLVDDNDTGERWTTLLELDSLYNDAEGDPIEYRVQILSGGMPYPIEIDSNRIVLRKAVENTESAEMQRITEYVTDKPESLEMEFRTTGVYEIVVSARDNECDWQDGYHHRVSLDSTVEKLLRICIFVAIGILLAVIMILILIQCLKKAYGQRVLHVKLSYHSWQQQNDVPLGAWKKKKVPFHWILSCAAFPPDEMIFSACSKVFLAPSGKGVQLVDGYGLNLSAESIINKKDRYLLGEGESMEIRFPKQEDANWDDVVITISLKF